MASGDYGDLNLEEFLRLTKEILPSTLNSPDILRKIFAVFTGSKDVALFEQGTDPSPATKSSSQPQFLDLKKLQSMQD